MARTGKVKSASEKAASGTYRKDRDSTRMETVLPPVDGIPPPPDHFDLRHKIKWNEVAEKVLNARILMTLDVDFLRSYVENWFLAEAAMKDMQERGSVIFPDNGEKAYRNPSHLAYMEAFKVIRTIGEKFGFSPRDRQSIKVQDNKPAKSAILEAMQGGLKKAQ